MTVHFQDKDGRILLVSVNNMAYDSSNQRVRLDLVDGSTMLFRLSSADATAMAKSLATSGTFGLSPTHIDLGCNMIS